MLTCLLHSTSYLSSLVFLCLVMANCFSVSLFPPVCTYIFYPPSLSLSSTPNFSSKGPTPPTCSCWTWVVSSSPSAMRKRRRGYRRTSPPCRRTGSAPSACWVKGGLSLSASSRWAKLTALELKSLHVRVRVGGKCRKYSC